MPYPFIFPDIFYVYFLETGSHSLTQAGVSLLSPWWLPATSTSWVQAILLPQPHRVTGITGTCHHAHIIFIFLVEMRFHHVGQAGLKLLTSGNSPALVSRSAEITGVSHSAQPTCLYFDCLSLIKMNLKAMHEEFFLRQLSEGLNPGRLGLSSSKSL